MLNSFVCRKTFLVRSQKGKKCVSKDIFSSPTTIADDSMAMHSTFKSVEMHSKRRYKICICSVILGELEAFQNFKGFSVIFPKILDAIERFKVMLDGTIRNDDCSA